MKYSTQHHQNANLESSKYHGMTWSILFLVNLAITFFVFYYVIDQTVGFNLSLKMFSSNNGNYETVKESYPEFDNQEFYGSIKYVKRSIKFATVATVISNLIHLFYAILFPKIYIKFHLVLSMVFSVIPAILLFMPQASSFRQGDNSLWGIIITLGFAGLGIWSFFYLQKYVDTSAQLMKASATLLKKHPSLLLIEMIQSFILLIINILYFVSLTAIRTCSSTVQFNPMIYVYGVFTYYWIIMTIYYTCYMTTAGVIGYEFYLRDTDSMPKNIVFYSFKRSITTNFGSAVFAGFILAIIQTLKFLVEFLNPKNRKNKKKKKENSDDDDNDKDDSQMAKILLYVLYYALNCILSLLESYFSFMSRQALVYCAVFGCSYKEGCDRYHNNNFSAKISKLQHESIISGATSTNYLLFMVLAGVAVYYGQSMIYHDNTDFVLMSVVFTEFLMLVFYTFINSLVTTASDTLFLCYLENPNSFLASNPELFQKFQKVKYE